MRTLYLSFISSSILAISACASLNEGLQPNKAEFVNSIQMDGRASTVTQISSNNRINTPSITDTSEVSLPTYPSVNVADWLNQKILLSGKATGVFTSCTNQTEFAATLSCYNEIFKDDEATYKRHRKELINVTTGLARTQCSQRLDVLGGYVSGGNTMTEFLNGTIGAAGIVSTDALTSRIASGVVSGVDQMWGSLQKNVLADQNIGNLSKLIFDSYSQYEESFEAKKNSSSSDWSMEDVIVDLQNYDNLCDLFN